MRRRLCRYASAVMRRAARGRSMLLAMIFGRRANGATRDRGIAAGGALSRRRTAGCPSRFRRMGALSCLMSACLMGTGVCARTAIGQLTREVAEINGMSLDMYVYRPASCVSPAFLFVFHGDGRAAKSYAASAQEIADRACMTIVAPHFDEDRFSSRDYHRGGVVDEDGLKPRDEWTTSVVGELIEWAEEMEGRPGQDIYLFGHSAGGQFLSRVAAYDRPEGVKRIVIANPSTHVLPTTDEEVPYGFGGFPAPEATEMIRRYLAAPVTIFLGEEDTGEEDLTRNEQADRQGENRLERGERTFEMARQVAADHGWDFNWRLIHADDVGHSGRGMLQSDDLIDALR